MISVKRAKLEIVRQAEFVHVTISVRLYKTEHKSNTVSCLLFALQPEDLQTDVHVSKHPPAALNFQQGRKCVASHCIYLQHVQSS